MSDRMGFIKFESLDSVITGECPDLVYKGWSDLYGFEHGVKMKEESTVADSIPNVDSGKSEIIKIEKPIDMATPELSKCLIDPRLRKLPSIEIRITASFGSTLYEIVEYTFKDVHLLSQDLSLMEEPPTESLNIHPEYINAIYTELDAEGNTVKTVEYTWDPVPQINEKDREDAKKKQEKEKEKADEAKKKEKKAETK